METFEIHITGKDSEFLTVARELGMRSICVLLYNPNEEVRRREYMTSEEFSVPNFGCALALCDEMCAQLKVAGVEVTRAKVECPAHYRQYWDKSLYMESHFDAFNFGGYPVSRQSGKTKFMATDRTWDHDEYERHVDYWGSWATLNKAKCQTELALYDTNAKEDSDWLDLWEHPEHAAV